MRLCSNQLNCTAISGFIDKPVQTLVQITLHEGFIIEYLSILGFFQHVLFFTANNLCNRFAHNFPKFAK